MAYDEETAARFRDALSGMEGVSEKKMMGGICFLLNGNMVGGASGSKMGDGAFMFRVGKDNHEAGLALPGAEPMVMGKRKMTGFFYVDKACDEAVLKEWVSLALSNAAALPPK